VITDLVDFAKERRDVSTRRLILSLQSRGDRLKLADCLRSAAAATSAAPAALRGASLGAAIVAAATAAEPPLRCAEPLDLP
jgi:hypothetical protein